MKIITKEIYSNGDAPNWTNRAGTFLEQSRAFLDSYLSRWDRGPEEHGDDGDLMDECTSGATSGEDVWGTPTSGENDEMQMFNSDHTNSVSSYHPNAKCNKRLIHSKPVAHQIVILADRRR